MNYMFVGVASPTAWVEAGNQPPYFNHNPHYRVELDAIPLGTSAGATAVFELLARTEN